MDEDMYNEYEEEEEDFGTGLYSKRLMPGIPAEELYFFEGTYKLRTISYMFADQDEMHLSCVVEPTSTNVSKRMSLIDLYEYFEKTYLLEFLIVVIGNSGINNMTKCKKLINIDERSSRILVTAVLNQNQRYCGIEDEVESDLQTTDIIKLGKDSVMRTHQFFYSTTQAVKYSIVKYSAFSDSLDWTSDKVDWAIVYKSLIEPYILLMMRSALKVPDLDKPDQYKEYMTFYVQYAIARTKSSFYCEIYILPKTVFGHSLVYNGENGRQILIGVKTDNQEDYISINSDEFRLCAGTQNLNLLPLNILNLKSTIDNGNRYLVLDEVPMPYDTIMNRFILGMNQYSKLPIECITYFDMVPGIDPCIYNIYNKYESVFTYYGFVDSSEHKSIFIELISNIYVLGVATFALKNTIPYNELCSTSKESKDQSLLPLEFYEKLRKVYDLKASTDFVLTPIRALPNYREYMVAIYISDSESNENHSDIINKKEETDAKPKKKSRFFKIRDVM